MAYQSKDLSVLAYANGFTLWHYTTADSGNTVDTSGYFNAASTMLRVGDIVVANVDTAATMKAGLFLVSANTGGVVDVNDLTQIGSADSR
ncbi:hypothetical protein [Paramagnetospirillum magneticum]|uniref:Uncharacterized protein n=1 Tax=Paramagnetospirillum magneticum (strain ATCC 700264 / AMB-1) TaxID=342108 RepID=Q2VZA3_PARM1|nr:hypothetical protein [Paramagnetospirillum magneticum]BAE53072.1 hypothetical protein amb4268 [Paramagnetospirillum magneticum AMB-1]